MNSFLAVFSYIEHEISDFLGYYFFPFIYALLKTISSI